MDAPTRVLHFCPAMNASTDGVFHATVLPVAKFLTEMGCEARVVVSDVSPERAAAAARRIESDFGLRAEVLPCFSLLHGFGGTFRLAKRMRLDSRDVVRTFQPTHVISLGFIHAAQGRVIAAANDAVSVFAVQGIKEAEVTLNGGSRLRAATCAWLERREMRKADRVYSVSHGMRRYIEHHTGRQDCLVVPCCVDVERFGFDPKARAELRAQFGLSDEHKVICYAGGVQLWQRVADILALFDAIARRDERFRFLFLTNQDERLRQMMADSGLAEDRVRIHSCRHDEVQRYLSSADAGIIMRDDVPTNNVASPIKVGEYLGCGLPVLLTRGIGDYSEMVTEFDCGVLLDEEGDPAGQVIRYMNAQSSAEHRAKAMKLAHERVSLDAYKGVFAEILRPKE